jgi:hypothetical protein
MLFAARKLPVALIAATVIFATAEVTARYMGHGSPGVDRLLSRFSFSSKPKAAPAEANPFDIGGDKQQIAPFIGYGFINCMVSCERDYFGFRNHLGNDVYARHERPLIVMTGNSELVGITHPVDIPTMLEQELKQRSLQFDVLNLAVNGYTLAAEASAYLQFGDRACPSLVIAHSGAADAYYGMVVPSKFRELGLNYHPPMEEWAHRAIDLKPYKGPALFRQRDPSVTIDEVYSSVEPVIAQYRSIVERGGHAKFLFGAQKLGPPQSSFPFITTAVQNQGYVHLKSSLDRLKVDYIWFNDDPKIEMADNIHSTYESAKRIASIYADWVQAHSTELRANLKKDGTCW